MRRNRHGRGVNLVDPGQGPRRSRDYVKAGPMGAIMVVVAVGLWAAWGPIASGASRAGAWVEDAAGAWAGWSGSLQDIADDEPAPTTVPVAIEPLRESQSLLLVVGDGAAAGFALVAVPPSGEPRVVMFPSTLLVLVPGLGEFTLTEALGFGGAGLVSLAIANQMGLRIDAVAAFDPGDLETVVGEPIVVDVPVALLIEEPNGERRLIAEGRQRLGPDFVEQLLTRQGTGDQFDLLQRQEAAWEALIVAVAEIPGLADRIAAASDDSATAAEALRLLASTDTPDIGAPPVDRVSLGAEEEAFILASGSASAYIIDVLDHLLLVVGPRPRVEVLNGNGIPGSTDAVTGDLVRAGFFVIKTGNADRFDYPTTEVIAQGTDAEAAARRAVEVLGMGEALLEATASSAVVDVSIIIGTDIPAGEG
jgi:hypothetical protein